jgi:NADH dehydrogenase
VLVAGGTGRLGGVVVSALLARGIQVRVLTREASRADAVRRDGADIAVGDLRRPESLPAAFHDVDVVVSAVQGFAGPGRVSPKSVDEAGNLNLIAAAEAAGAAVVLVSIVGAAPDSPMELFRCKYTAEQRLQASSVPWTIVRATAFVELWADILETTRMVFGRGDNPINFVAVADVAAVVVDAVLGADRRGRIIEIGGPADLSFNDLAAAVREVRGGPASVRHLPRWLLHAMAPLHRQPRAALVMDTADMTYAAAPGRVIGTTDVRQAIARAT